MRPDFVVAVLDWDDASSAPLTPARAWPHRAVMAGNSPVYGPGWKSPPFVAQGVAGKPGLFLPGRTVYFCPFQPGVQQATSCIATRHPTLPAACYTSYSNPKQGSSSPDPQLSPLSSNHPPDDPNDGVLNLPLRSRPRTAPFTLVQGMWTFSRNNEKHHHLTANSVESDQHHTEDTT